MIVYMNSHGYPLPLLEFKTSYLLAQEIIFYCRSWNRITKREVLQWRMILRLIRLQYKETP